MAFVLFEACEKNTRMGGVVNFHSPCLTLVVTAGDYLMPIHSG
jgi:hypothetical protein